MKVMSKNKEVSEVDDNQFFTIYHQIEKGRSYKKDVIVFLIMSAIMAFIYFKYL